MRRSRAAIHICAGPYLRLRDALRPVFTDQRFAALFPSHGQPAEAAWRFALVTLLQFAENLSDRRAADAGRSRIDWKHLLGLELADPGFDAFVLSQFRSRLVAGGAEALLLDTLLALCREKKLLASRGRQRTDSTHVLGAVRCLNRLNCAIDTLRAALNVLAIAAPEWLRVHADPAWADRYAKPADDYDIPLGEAARRAWMQNFLLAPAKAGEQQGMDGPDEGGTLAHWRTPVEDFPTSLQMVGSPYDPEAHYARKRSTAWIGDKVHLTETCDKQRPHLIAHVETTPAPVVDRGARALIRRSLAGKGLLPAKRLVDAGDVDADQLVASVRDHDVELIGPTPKNNQWQARTEGAFTSRASRSTGTGRPRSVRPATPARTGPLTTTRTER